MANRLISEKYLTINGKKTKFKKVDKFSIRDYIGSELSDAILHAVNTMVIDDDDNYTVVDSKEEADRMQKRVDKGFKMVGVKA